MFLSGNPSISHSTEIYRKRSVSLVSFVAVLCAGIIAGSSSKNNSGELDIVTNIVSDSNIVEIFPIVSPNVTAIKLPTQESSRMIIGDYGYFLSHLFRDLKLDSLMMMRLIQRESGGDTTATSTKGAKGILQVRDTVLDDMGGIEGIRRYGSFFTSINIKVLEKMTYREDLTKMLLLKNLIRHISLTIRSKDTSNVKNLVEQYNQLIFSLKVELYNPEINVILGSVYMKYLDKLARDFPDDRLDVVSDILENLSEDDINRINQFRLADKRKTIPDDYDFSALDTRKIITLSMYNVGPNAKDIKTGVLYAIAILA